MVGFHGFGRQSVVMVVAEEGEPDAGLPEAGELAPAAEKCEIGGSIGGSAPPLGELRRRPPR
jgi:hypothetical protein